MPNSKKKASPALERLLEIAFYRGSIRILSQKLDSAFLIMPIKSIDGYNKRRDSDEDRGSANI